MVVEREEPFEKEESQKPDHRPPECAGRTEMNGLGQHVEERRAEHRPGRETQVELKSCMSENRRERQGTAQ